MRRAAYPCVGSHTRNSGWSQEEADTTQLKVVPNHPESEEALGPQALDAIAQAGAQAMLRQALDLRLWYSPT